MPDSQDSRALEQQIAARLAAVLAQGEAAEPDTVKGLAQALSEIHAVNKPQERQQPYVVNLGNGKIALVDPTKLASPDGITLRDLGHPSGNKPETVNVPGVGVLQWNPPESSADPNAAGWSVVPGSTPRPEPPPVTAATRYIPDPQRPGAFTENPNFRPEDTASALAAQNNAAAMGRQQAGDAAALQRSLAVADAQFKQRIGELQYKIDQGLELSERDKLALQNAYAERLTTLQNQLTIERDRAKFALEQPGQERTFALQQQTQAEAAAHNQAIEQQQADTLQRGVRQDVESAGQARRLSQAQTLYNQSQTIGSAVDSAVSRGVAPTAGVIDAQFSALDNALRLMREGVKGGSLDPSWLPTPLAPRPPGTPAQPPLEAPAPYTPKTPARVIPTAGYMPAAVGTRLRPI